MDTKKYHQLKIQLDFQVSGKGRTRPNRTAKANKGASQQGTTNQKQVCPVYKVF